MDMAPIYQQASEWTARVIAGVKADQHEDSTPCTEWNVGELMNHIIGGTFMFANAISGGPPPDPNAPPPDLLGDDPARTYRGAAQALITAFEQPGALEVVVNLPAGELNGETVYAIATSEAAIHGWDLAKATGQDTSQEDDLVEAVYQIVAPGVQFGRDGGFYGPEVNVADGASKQERLLGMMGRRP